MKRYLLAIIVIWLILSPRWAMTAAASDPKLSMSTSGGVTFPAGNPSVQTVTPASTTLVATVTIAAPKAADAWSLTIRGANSNFTTASGAPIAISNVHWSAAGTVIQGNGSVTVSSGQYLGTSDIVVASGLQGPAKPFTVQVTFTLTVNNSWTYDAGTYLQDLVLTATAN
jgi:hypothetical protein